MKRHVKFALPAAVVAAGTAAAVGIAAGGDTPFTSPVLDANTRAQGYAPASLLAGGLQQIAQAQGSTALENPAGPNGWVGWYGYENDVPAPDQSMGKSQPQMVPAATYANGANANEAQKTEPDENTYLVFKKGEMKGFDPSYDYGTHFLYQGHEAGSRVNPDGSPAPASDTGKPKQGLITRINLDADSAHRVTLLATNDSSGNPIATIDGSTWDPWAQRLLFTTESAGAPTYAATPNYPSTVVDVSSALGRGGYEGIQNDSAGNIWIVEDIGGSGKSGGLAKRPNSFVYRYVPDSPGDLQNGKLQALQVLSSAGEPITFASQAAVDNPDQMALHHYGTTFQTRWVTIHDTHAANPPDWPNANLVAKAARATPFKRPENGRFRPGSDFKEFYFDETGDTNSMSPENDSAGGWGGIQKLVQSSPSANTGTLTLFYKGDQAHTGLDNTTFLTKDLISFVEDAGDTLHEQRDALDSGWVFDVKVDYSKQGAQPTRWLAQGRDASATIDAANGGFPLVVPNPNPPPANNSFTRNDGDNEITGAIVSDGDPKKDGILGTKDPHALDGPWRWFYTQQHGDNPTYEVVKQP